MFSSREGFTLDAVAGPVRSLLLNPFINVAIATLLSTQPTLAYIYTRLPSIDPISIKILALGSAYLLALGSIILSLNDYLNRQFANNWVADNTWDWDKEIVVVTGGSSGIGASISQQLLAKNPRTRIVIVDIVPLTWKPAADARVSYYQCDLTDSPAIKATFARIRDEVGDPTVLFNNAGLIRGTSIMEGSYADVEITVRANLIAPMLVLKEVLPAMVRNDHGHILHTGSLSCLTPPALIADYSATKAGLLALHEALQLELKDIHNAPRVRLTMGIFSFIRTPLIKGHPNLPNFIAPFLHVDSVGERLVNAVYSGYGSTIFMPGIAGYLVLLKGGPYWLFHLVRQGTAVFAIDYRGRQNLDKQTGKLDI
ncbi:Dehydrogenase RED2 [Cladobotryum mycophilum]|uniref:Dehydrogenase RED2 n=1 Tax=Cladobotryum mycophilum TaxID=491253 RepID=A0ABR0T4F5_9HYPO